MNSLLPPSPEDTKVKANSTNPLPPQPERTNGDDTDDLIALRENNGDSDNDSDDDLEDNFRDPPVDHVRLRPSQFAGIPATVFVEYPPELKIKRNDISVLEPLGKRKMMYRSYWERICIRNAFRRAGFTKIESASGKWTIMWSKHQNDAQMKDLNCLQKVNHFPHSWCVGRKDRLNRTMNTMKRIHGNKFDFHPEGYILPANRDAFLRRVTTDMESMRTRLGAGAGGSSADVSKKNSSEQLIERSSMWILKPCASSCGRGIKVLTASQALQVPKNKAALLQRYLSDPYLIDGKKFDLRIYVLVTGVDPLRVYVHNEGLTRISTSKYSLKNTNNRFAHLTNYSINKKSKVFKAAAMVEDAAAQRDEDEAEAEHDNDDIEDDGGSEENEEKTPSTKSNPSVSTKASSLSSCPEREGYKWSLAAFRRWLAEKESKEVMHRTFEKIHDLCCKTMIAAESEITPKLHQSANFRTNCFELFGCDVILDKDLEPHLLEVNVSPSLTGSSPLDKKIKGTLIADIMHVVGTYPHDSAMLHKYENDTSATTANGQSSTSSSSSSSANSGLKHGNPFAFASLSKLMEKQDLWRKCPEPASVSISSLGNNMSAWLMLLMAEDEFSRAKSTQFLCLHPTTTMAVHYNSLYRSCRFSDHLLAKWIISGMSKGQFRKYIPQHFIKSSSNNSDREKSDKPSTELNSAPSSSSTAPLIFPSPPRRLSSKTSMDSTSSTSLSPRARHKDATPKSSSSTSTPTPQIGGDNMRDEALLHLLKNTNTVSLTEKVNRYESLDLQDANMRSNLHMSMHPKPHFQYQTTISHSIATSRDVHRKGSFDNQSASSHGSPRKVRTKATQSQLQSQSGFSSNAIVMDNLGLNVKHLGSSFQQQQEGGGNTQQYHQPQGLNKKLLPSQLHSTPPNGRESAIKSTVLVNSILESTTLLASPRSLPPMHRKLALEIKAPLPQKAKISRVTSIGNQIHFN